MPKKTSKPAMASPPRPPAIPTVDLSPFLTAPDGSEAAAAREAAKGIVAAALRATGFFRLANHGVPAELMHRALALSRDFFSRPDEEKLRWRPAEVSRAPLLPAGYARQPEASPDKNEYLLVFSPESGLNVYPADPEAFGQVLEGLFVKLAELAALMEGILSECMGLPADFLKEYRGGGSCDLMVALRYFPAVAGDDNGIGEHEDGNILTFVFQDDVGGLEVLADGEWLPASPEEGTIIVNIGDVIQVLTNKIFKSATHRVVRKPTHRHSYAFFRNLDGDKWVEPLRRFTAAAGVEPRYRGFLYKEYQQQRVRNKTHPPARREDAITISHYAI